MSLSTITIHRADELYQRVLPLVHQMVARPGDEPAGLEVLLAEGRYEGLALDLQVDVPRMLDHVVLRGADPQNPPLLVGTSLSLLAGVVEVSDLVFVAGLGGVPALAMGFCESATLSRCAFLENRGGPWATTALLELRGYPGRTSRSARIVDSWFVDNRFEGESHLLQWRSDPPPGHDDLSLAGCGFLGNQSACLLHAGLAGQVHLNRCLLVTDRAEEQPGTPLVQGDWAGLRLDVTECVLYGYEASHMASKSPTDGDTPSRPIDEQCRNRAAAALLRRERLLDDLKKGIRPSPLSWWEGTVFG